MKCPNCGAEFEVKSIFCENCGVKIDYELIEKLEKEEKAAAKAEKENDVFYRAAKRQERKHSIIIAVFNFVLFLLFFSNWFGSDLFDLFDDFGFNYFDAIGTVTGLSRLSYESENGFFAIIKEIPAAMFIVVLCTLSAYVTSACALFASSIRIFANKTKASTEKLGLWSALIAGALAYIAMYAFQNGIDKELGSGVGSHLVSTSGWFFIFLITALILLVRTNKVVKDSDGDFTEKGKKTFDIVTKIYNICIILGLLFGIGIISLPTINLPEKEVKETKTYTNLYDAARDMPENQNNNYDYDYDYSDDTNQAEYIPEDNLANDDYGYTPVPESNSKGIVTYDEAGINYSDYYGEDYEFIPAGSVDWYVHEEVIPEVRIDFSEDTDSIDVSDIQALFPNFCPKGDRLYIEDGNLMFYSASHDASNYFNPEHISALYNYTGDDFRTIAAMLYKDFIDENGFIVVDVNYYGVVEKALVLSCELDCFYSFIPNGVEVISSYAYYGTKITQIFLPDSAYDLRWSCFENCEVETIIANGINFVGKDSFKGTYINYEY